MGDFILRIFVIVVGGGCGGVRIELFLVGKNIIDGGMMGISVILDYVFRDKGFINFGRIVVILNIGFMI
ncbi:YitT family protein [Bacillus sp. WP8]|uniref:YitT family protein n=1 Tax=Bacillus sp. WP8 TaxID=756828 RepID=UPI0021B457A7|nr:YitT family protein [Bacillus sp. WP8]